METEIEPEYGKNIARTLKRLGNEERYRKHLQQLESLSNMLGYPAHYDEDKGRIVRSCRGSRSRFYKHASARAVRHYRGNIRSGAAYRRVYDYWWMIW